MRLPPKDLFGNRMMLSVMVAVLFDLEGTLVQTVYDDQESRTVRELRRGTKEKLIALGIPPRLLMGIKKSTIMRNRASEYVEENFGRDETKRFHREIDRFMEDHETRSAESSKIFTETHPTLRQLKTLGYKMGLITNTSKRAADRIFSMHGLRDYFEVVITREDMKNLKPDSEGVLLALKKLHEENFFLVGDTIFDALVAKRAGGTSIVVKRDPSKDLEFHADHIVQSLAEIPALIHERLSF